MQASWHYQNIDRSGVERVDICNYYKKSIYQHDKSLAAEIQTTIDIDNSNFTILSMTEK